MVVNLNPVPVCKEVDDRVVVERKDQIIVGWLLSSMGTLLSSLMLYAPSECYNADC